MYSKYVNPPHQPVYRVITISVKKAKEIFGQSLKKSLENPKKVVLLNNGGVLNTSNITSQHKVQSWSLDPNITTAFMHFSKNSITAIFQADPYDSENDFYLNPIEIKNQFKDFYGFYDEDEVLSYGPVTYQKVAIAYVEKIAIAGGTSALEDNLASVIRK